MIKKLISQEILSQQESFSLMQGIARGDYQDSELAAILTAFRLRSVTVPELIGFRSAILEFAIKPKLEFDNLIDVCGTGGDGKDTFNISTLSALVLALCGVKVAKHGNNSFSSKCGSSNVLQSLGINLTNDPKLLDKCLRECQICFLHAPLFHPALKNVATVRKSLGFRTIFNLLGPLVNPLQPNFQLVGVADLSTFNLYQQVLGEVGQDYVLVHSYDGYDEISLTGKFIAVSNHFQMEVFPEELGLERTNLEALRGGLTIEDSSNVFKKIIKGEGTIAQRSVVSANVATALKLVNPKSEWSSNYQQSLEILATNRLHNLVETLAKITNEN